MPSSIKVGPHIFLIARKKSAQMPKQDGYELNGQTDKDGLRINIRDRLRKSKSQEVLLHETLHTAVNSFFEGKTLDEEEWVSHLSPILLQIIKDNPDLISYLQS